MEMEMEIEMEMEMGMEMRGRWRATTLSIERMRGVLSTVQGVVWRKGSYGVQRQRRRDRDRDRDRDRERHRGTERQRKSVVVCAVQCSALLARCRVRRRVGGVVERCVCVCVCVCVGASK